MLTLFTANYKHIFRKKGLFCSTKVKSVCKKRLITPEAVGQSSHRF